MKPKVGLLTFGEQREEFYIKRKKIVEEESRKIISALKGKFKCVSPSLIRSKSDMVSAVEILREQNVSCVIISLPIWSAPNLPAMAVRLLQIPVVLYGNNRLDSSSQVAMLATGGALDQMGFPHKRLIGDIDGPSILENIDVFCTAAQTAVQLRGATYGCFGGRSLGICTTTADLAQWQTLFGIDIEHIDQMEIVRIAKGLEKEEVQRHIEWVKANFGKIKYNGASFTPEIRLILSIKSFKWTMSRA